MSILRALCAGFLLALFFVPFVAQAATVEITIRDFAFAPKDAQAEVGDVIRWRNGDSTPHSATAEGRFDVSVPVGETGEITVMKSGTIDYHCDLHPDMKGRISVAPR